MDYEVDVVCAATAGKLMRKGVADAIRIKPGHDKTVYDWIRDAHRTSGMQPDKLVMMANQSPGSSRPRARNARSRRLPITSRKFWDPRMRKEVSVYVAQGGEGLDPLARAAVAKLK